VPEYIQKDKALNAIIPLHTLAGSQNGFPNDALSCGILSGTIHSIVAPASISSALYVETFNGPSSTDAFRHHPLWSSIAFNTY
jgi:hypothetical protein